MFANDLKRNFVIGLFAYANCVSKVTLSGAVIWNESRRTCAKSLSLSLSKRAITLGGTARELLRKTRRGSSKRSFLAWSNMKLG